LETDGFHQQMQVLLSNGLTDIGMLWRFGRIGFAWRGKTRVWRRSALLLTACIVHAVLISAAGLFASRIADAADHVLVRYTDKCGWYDLTPYQDLFVVDTLSDQEINALDSLAISTRSGISEAQQYSKTCYSWLDGFIPDNSSASCSQYVLPSLQSTINRNATCPFAAQACSGPAISFDSGRIDSNDHLGINGLEKDRLQIRRMMTCAPVPLEQRYSLPWAESPLDPGQLVKFFQLGEAYNSSASTFNGTFDITNTTLSTSGPNDLLLAFPFPCCTTDFANQHQSSMSYKLVGDTDLSSFEPISDFAHDDADVYIVALLRNVAYSRQIDDPVYEAGEQITFQLASAITPLWISNLSVTGFGCINQYEICAQDKCTDPGGLLQISNYSVIADSLDLTPTQTATLAVFWRSLYTSQTYVLSTLFSSDLLRSRERIPTGDTPAVVQNANLSVPSKNYFYSTPVNSFQWEIEAQNLQNIALAWLQQSVIDHVAPTAYLLAEGVVATNYLLHSSDPGEKNICSAQKVRSAAFTSISVFGLVFVIVAGVIITLLAFSVPAVVKLSQTRTATADSLYRRDEWEQMDVLQLARSFSESQYPGTWGDPRKAVPTTLDFNRKMTWKIAEDNRVKSTLT
jgi:hypothetical protein